MLPCPAPALPPGLQIVVCLPVTGRTALSWWDTVAFFLLFWDLPPDPRKVVRVLRVEEVSALASRGCRGASCGRKGLGDCSWCEAGLAIFKEQGVVSDLEQGIGTYMTGTTPWPLLQEHQAPGVTSGH